MSDDELFENVIRAAFGRRVDDTSDGSYRGTVRDLPVILGGMSPFQCSRCPRVFQPATFHVEVGVEPICRYCATADAELAPWQGFCDVMDMVDHVMQQASGRNQRLLLAELAAKYADHFAWWRWPEEEPGDAG
ncbi:hypothetical protein [Micromonospora globbae]|uniref:Uncharacterized protein n=1 Tax=Micromonospora globbae TaxID=1894969 RepID=A0A420EU11_9ACTN|nr:hypothetical protein [Micromonospora globbae]RKF24129.1 hypothetical protein D7I43_28000 [Micromonospora globbae]